MKIPDKKREEIMRLIADGENLDPLDLGNFYVWIHESFEALGFHPFQQQRFDEYCRSSGDSTSMRIYVGVWVLKLTLR